jgi:2-polyprenyl-3-methyl-5-hydroxy-6-metoxy-1,4-benzoquinol methylase
MSAATSTVCWACGATGLEPAELPAIPPSLRCPACGMVRAAVTDPHAVRELYGASYYQIYGGLDAGYDADPERRRYESHRRLRLVQRFVRGGRLVEIGSAVGYFLDAAKRAGFEVTGIEPAEELARTARERFGVDARAGFIEDAELEPGSFDVACAWHVLEHIPEPLAVLRNLHRVVGRGGVLALEVPNAASRQAERLGAAWPHWDPAHHVGHYTPAALRALVERAGFDVALIDTLSGTAYYPPRQALRPGAIAGYAREATKLRAIPRRRHASAHELLRLIALGE